MYFAAKDVSDERVVEGFVTSTLLLYFVAGVRAQKRAFKIANEKGGAPKPKPTPFHVRVATVVPPLALFPPLLIYMISVPLNGWKQPAFLARCELPTFGLSEETIKFLRLSGCLSFIGIWKLFQWSLDHIGQSFHSIGVREKAKLVDTGPYAIVRHPLYSISLLQELVFVVISWNYIPVYALVILVVSLVVKIPMEEDIIESDPDIGKEYAVYKKKVPYSFVPGVW